MKIRNYTLVAFVNSLGGVCLGLFGPVFAIFVQNIGGSLLDIGFAYSILLTITGVLMIPFGHMADKYGMKKLCLISNVIYSMAMFSYAFVSSVFQVYALQTVLGICNAMWISFWNVIVVDVADKNKRGKEVGFLTSTFWTAQGLAGIVGASIAYFLSFHKSQYHP